MNPMSGINMRDRIVRRDGSQKNLEDKLKELIRIAEEKIKDLDKKVTEVDVKVKEMDVKIKDLDNKVNPK